MRSSDASSLPGSLSIARGLVHAGSPNAAPFMRPSASARPSAGSARLRIPIHSAAGIRNASARVTAASSRSGSARAVAPASFAASQRPAGTGASLSHAPPPRSNGRARAATS